jgi:hypothetical protein
VNWDAIGAVGEVLGAAGVIISLLYLAVQIRGDARAKRASAVHEQSGAYRDFLQTLANDGELADIYLRGVRDFDSVKDADLIRFSSALGFLFRVFDEAFFQWKEGHLDPHVWLGFESPIADMVAYPGVRDWWAGRSHWYSIPFQEFIQSKIVAAEAPALYGEAAARPGAAGDSA